MPRRDDAMAELRTALSGAPGTRSSLHQWMRVNHDEVSALLEEVRPNWRRLADAFARMGLTDGAGKPPRPQTARSQGRDVIVADGDVRSRTLAGLFLDEALVPSTGELPDIKTWLTQVLNRMIRDRRSAVLDLGGGDRVLQEYGRDLRLVEFCARRGIDPLALYFLGPEEEDLRHVLSIWEAGYFRPARCLLVLNEGVIREGRTVAGAFERTVGHPGFKAMVGAGAVPILMTRLACMDALRTLGAGFYRAAAGDGIEIDPVEQFMVEDWLADLEAKRAKAGASAWLP